MGYYDAKFLRENQDNPCEWVIFPVGFDRYKLVYIGPSPEAKPRREATIGDTTSVPYLRIVK